MNTMEITETLGQRVTRLREEKGLSKQRLCGLAGISSKSLLLLERDDIAGPAYHLLVRLSKVLDVTIESWEPYVMQNFED